MPEASDRVAQRSYGVVTESGEMELLLLLQDDRGELSQQVADYLDAVRHRHELPPHAYPAGFFLDAMPSRDLAALQLDSERAPLSPVRPLSQDVFAADAPDAAVYLQRLPDFGRSVQLWWDEMAPNQPPPRAGEIVRFIALAEWRGRVDAIGGETFKATVWARATQGLQEQAEFSQSQLSAADRGRLEPGAQFYWTVGYTENTLGERASTSRIRFRRMRDAPTPERARDAAAEAEDLLRVVGDGSY
jgi:hypothetical protein